MRQIAFEGRAAGVPFSLSGGLLIPLSSGLVIAKKLRLDREIARGGMGSVWAAHNTQLEAPVAVKFMAPDAVGSPELVARFQREARAAAQIRSPHVVQIFEHGMHLGLPFIVMELLEGEDLGARLRRTERLSLTETGEIVTQVCKALRRAHEMGIVHRDLKPANVFLARHDDDEVVKVLDFGIAKSLAATGEGDEATTQTGTLVGTPHYMSPEQAQRSKLIDARADLWSLGVIAFRAITGRVPFKGDDMINVLVKVCTEPAPVPSSLHPELGPEVDAFFARALSRDLGGRFQTAREMAEAFGALIGRRSLQSELSLASYVPPPPSSRAGPGIPRPSASGRIPQAPSSSPASVPAPSSRGAVVVPSPPGVVAVPSPPGVVAVPSPPGAVAVPSSTGPAVARTALEPSPVAEELTEADPPAQVARDAVSPPSPTARDAGRPSSPALVPPPAPSTSPLSTVSVEPAMPSVPASLSSSFPGTLTGAGAETPILPPALRPSKARVVAVLGGGALLLAILVAAWSGSSSSPSSTGLTPEASASQVPATAAPSASPRAVPPSGAPTTNAPPSSATAPVPSASAPTSATSTTATPATAAPPASARASDARPASSPKGTLPRGTAGPRSTGAIGGAPRF